MYSLRPGVQFKEFPPSILKRARPLARQKNLCYVAAPEIVADPLKREPHTFVTQEQIRPALMRTTDDHDKPVTRRFRLVIVSYNGRILTSGCVVELPDDGETGRHVGSGVYVVD